MWSRLYPVRIKDHGTFHMASLSYSGNRLVSAVLVGKTDKVDGLRAQIVSGRYFTLHGDHLPAEFSVHSFHYDTSAIQCSHPSYGELSAVHIFERARFERGRGADMESMHILTSPACPEHTDEAMWEALRFISPIYLPEEWREVIVNQILHTPSSALRGVKVDSCYMDTGHPQWQVITISVTSVGSLVSSIGAFVREGLLTLDLDLAEDAEPGRPHTGGNYSSVQGYQGPRRDKS